MEDQTAADHEQIVQEIAEAEALHGVTGWLSGRPGLGISSCSSSPNHVRGDF